MIKFIQGMKLLIRELSSPIYGVLSIDLIECAGCSRCQKERALKGKTMSNPVAKSIQFSEPSLCLWTYCLAMQEFNQENELFNAF